MLLSILYLINSSPEVIKRINLTIRFVLIFEPIMVSLCKRWMYLCLARLDVFWAYLNSIILFFQRLFNFSCNCLLHLISCIFNLLSQGTKFRFNFLINPFPFQFGLRLSELSQCLFDLDFILRLNPIYGFNVLFNNIAKLSPQLQLQLG